MKKELEKVYDPSIEERLYNKWLDKKYFHTSKEEQIYYTHYYSPLGFGGLLRHNCTPNKKRRLIFLQKYTNMKLLIIALFQSIIITSGQVMLKYGLLKIVSFELSWNFFRTIVSNVPLILSGVAMVVGTAMWIWMVKVFPLSQLLPLQTLGYVLGILASMFCFNESVSLSQWAGMLFIIIGCVLIGK